LYFWICSADNGVGAFGVAVFGVAFGCLTVEIDPSGVTR